jgi:hypothetical protein
MTEARLEARVHYQAERSWRKEKMTSNGRDIESDFRDIMDAAGHIMAGRKEEKLK